MKWLSRLKKGSTTEIADNQAKEKTVKQIQKELERLRDEYKKMELRPCRGDLDLIRRDKDLVQLKGRIFALEKERDSHLYTWQY